MIRSDEKVRRASKIGAAIAEVVGARAVDLVLPDREVFDSQERMTHGADCHEPCRHGTSSRLKNLSDSFFERARRRALTWVQRLTSRFAASEWPSGPFNSS